MIMPRQTNCYSQWHTGHSAHLCHTMSAEDVLAFVELTRDTNPIHRDGSASRYGQVLVPGVMLGSLATGIVGSRLPGPGCLLVSQEFTYLLPVEVGETVELHLVISATDDRSRQITIDITCESEQHEIVMCGTIVVKLRS